MAENRQFVDGFLQQSSLFAGWSFYWRVQNRVSALERLQFADFRQVRWVAKKLRSCSTLTNSWKKWIPPTCVRPS